MAYININDLMFKSVCYVRLDILANAEIYKSYISDNCPDKEQDNYNILSLFLRSLDTIGAI